MLEKDDDRFIDEESIKSKINILSEKDQNFVCDLFINLKKECEQNFKALDEINYGNLLNRPNEETSYETLKEMCSKITLDERTIKDIFSSEEIKLKFKKFDLLEYYQALEFNFCELLNYYKSVDSEFGGKLFPGIYSPRIYSDIKTIKELFCCLKK